MRGWRLFVRAQVLRALAICPVLVAPFYTLVYLVHWKTIAMDLGERSTSSGRRILFYWSALPPQLGWTLLLLGILGILTSRWWDQPKATAVMLSWILACYVTFTLIGHQEQRYSFYWVPPFLYFAFGLLHAIFRKPRLRTLGGIAAVILVGVNLPPPGISSGPMSQATHQVAKRVTAIEPVGNHFVRRGVARQFYFFARGNDPDRRFPGAA